MLLLASSLFAMSPEAKPIPLDSVDRPLVLPAGTFELGLGGTYLRLQRADDGVDITMAEPIVVFGLTDALEASVQGTQARLVEDSVEGGLGVRVRGRLHQDLFELGWVFGVGLEDRRWAFLPGFQARATVDQLLRFDATAALQFRPPRGDRPADLALLLPVSFLFQLAPSIALGPETGVFTVSPIGAGAPTQVTVPLGVQLQLTSRVSGSIFTFTMSARLPRLVSLNDPLIDSGLSFRSFQASLSLAWVLSWATLFDSRASARRDAS